MRRPHETCRLAFLAVVSRPSLDPPIVLKLLWASAKSITTHFTDLRPTLKSPHSPSYIASRWEAAISCQIRQTLKKNKAKASFFFTGTDCDCYSVYRPRCLVLKPYQLRCCRHRIDIHASLMSTVETWSLYLIHQLRPTSFYCSPRLSLQL